jgi:hypothetical protein
MEGNMSKNKNNWKIIRRDIGPLSVLEITNSVLRNVNARDLYLEFLLGLKIKGNYYSLSQIFSPSQSRYSEYKRIINELEKIKPLKYEITSGFDSVDKIPETRYDYVIHVVNESLDKSSLSLLHFTGATVSNTIYYFREYSENWLQKITGWNRWFLDIFWLKSSINSLIDLETQVNLLAWTSDGHISIVAQDDQDLEEYIVLLREISNKYSLTLDISSDSFS